MSAEHSCDPRDAVGFCPDALRLTLLPGIGPRLYLSLTEYFGSAVKALDASESELRQVPGIGAKLARTLATARRDICLDDELGRCQQYGIRLVFDAAPEYPDVLRTIPDAPPLLYVRGDLQPRDAVALAIVGTRHATSYGRRQAERFGSTLARAGCTIVSGLARGIDGFAHRAALEAGGRTIAVLASGLTEVYPPEHKSLAEEIVQAGALISEFSCVSHLSPGVFPRRNRLISGLSLGVLVIEAGLQSGALTTARHAVEQNRDVFALPGPVDNRMSRGCHLLLREGACLVESPEDVLDALGPLADEVKISDEVTLKHPAELQLNNQEQLVLQSIESQPTAIDAVVVATGLPVPRVLSTLSVLEMRRLIRRVSGHLVCRS